MGVHITLINQAASGSPERVCHIPLGAGDKKIIMSKQQEGQLKKTSTRVCPRDGAEINQTARSKFLLPK